VLSVGNIRGRGLLHKFVNARRTDLRRLLHAVANSVQLDEIPAAVAKKLPRCPMRLKTSISEEIDASFSVCRDVVGGDSTVGRSRRARGQTVGVRTLIDAALHLFGLGRRSVSGATKCLKDFLRPKKRQTITHEQAMVFARVS